MKFFGKVGFVKTQEGSKGVWLPVETERDYYGDVIRNFRRWEASNLSTNDDLRMTNTLSLIADSYMQENLGYMKYVVWNGIKWKIDSISIEYPRIKIEFGGVYNG